MRLSLIAAALCATGLNAMPASAQSMDDVEIRVEPVSDNVAVLFGRGGNIALHHGPDGNVLIDDQYAPLTPKIMEAVRRFNDLPVRFVVNTHHHADHSGGNENLGQEGAIIMAHENVRARIRSELNDRGQSDAALPVLTFGDGVTLHWNDDRIMIEHVHEAHTDGDSIIAFTNQNVVHMGDTFFHQGSFPFIDLKAGGSINGMIAAVDGALPMIGDDVVVIPGHGPVTDRAGLMAYHRMLVDIRDGVAKGIREDKSLEEIQAMGLTDRYDVASDGFITPAKFVEAVYKSLTGSRDYSPR